MAKATASVTGGASASNERQTDLSKLRLLLALDALLRENSVSRAASSVGLQPSAMSRLLGQLREDYADPLFLRTGHGLRPTPLAESLRLRVRALAAETEALLDARSAGSASAPTQTGHAGWGGQALTDAPPLAARPSRLLEGEPAPEQFAAKLAEIGDDAAPERRLARCIATVGTGAGRSRPLSKEEAEDALAIILAGEADPVQIGALMTVLHYRGPTAVEVAGFVRAMRRHIGAIEPGNGIASCCMEATVRRVRIGTSWRWPLPQPASRSARRSRPPRQRFGRQASPICRSRPLRRRSIACWGSIG